MMYTMGFGFLMMYSLLFQVSQDSIPISMVQYMLDNHCGANGRNFRDYLTHRHTLQSLVYMNNNHKDLSVESDIHNFIAFDILYKLCNDEMTVYLYDTLRGENDSEVKSLRYLSRELDTDALYLVYSIRKAFGNGVYIPEKAVSYVNMTVAKQYFPSIQNEKRGAANKLSEYMYADNTSDLCLDDECEICHPILAFKEVMNSEANVSPLMYKLQSKGVQVLA